MADPVSIAIIGSTILSATAAVAGGVAAKKSADYSARQGEIAGGQAVASSQRAAYAERRKGAIVGSRAQAVAAASGAGATDPTVLDIMGDIDAQSEFNALTALYQGQSMQRDYQAQANLDRFEGKQKLIGGILEGGATLLKGGVSAYDKYGGGGFAKYNEKTGVGKTGPQGFPDMGYR